MGKGETGILPAVQDIRQALPFELAKTIEQKLDRLYQMGTSKNSTFLRTSPFSCFSEELTPSSCLVSNSFFFRFFRFFGLGRCVPGFCNLLFTSRAFNLKSPTGMTRSGSRSYTSVMLGDRDCPSRPRSLPISPVLQTKGSVKRTFCG